MKIDLYLHLLASIAILCIMYKLSRSLKSTIIVTICIQLGKEVYDYLIKGSDVDMIDFLGDGLAYIVLLPLIILNFKNKNERNKILST